MAILIPSKNIYEISNNKVLKNVIEKIGVNSTEVYSNDEYDVNVASQRFEIGILTNSTNIDEKMEARAYEEYGSNVQGTVDKIQAKIAYAKCLNKQTSKFTLKVPILQKNKYVSRLTLGKNQETGRSNIGVQYYGYINRGTAQSNGWECKGVGTQIGGSTVPKVTKKEISYVETENNSTKETTNINPPTKFSERFFENSTTRPTSPIDVVFDITYVGNILQDIEPSIQDDYFVLQLSIMHSFRIVQMAGEGLSVNSLQTTVDMSGTYSDFISRYIEVTIKGDKIGIDLQDKSITISEEGKANSKKVFSVENNELLQTSNYISGTNENAIEENYKNTLNAYKNGRETATLLCDINEYKDTNGNLAISTKQEGLPMTFNVGDEVIPMVYGANGEDFPMSQKDGVPKVFVVSSVKPYYDGAVWQQIEIQEKTS